MNKMMTNMEATPPHISKFQQLLRELFQFDCADLDFGIYRIMNYKRDAIERFITEDLVQTVSDELDSGPLVQQIRAAQELEEAAHEVRETLGEYIDAQGNLDEMENAGQELAEGWFQMLRLIKSVGSRIIDFLDQIESFQKMLWEKRKFIIETGYCIRVGIIDEGFYSDIAACDAQWNEWEDLFDIDETQDDLFNSGVSRQDRRLDFLKARPALVVDTKHFRQEFVERLLATYETWTG